MQPARAPAVTVIVSLLLAVVPGRLPAALEETSCRLLHELLPAEFAQCAELVVPLDHSDPNSPSVALFVARVPATTATPEPDPLVLINGGPGGSSVDLYLQNRGAFLPVLRDRDIVLLDQRGT
ncbi:MAG: hypothetical protein R3305_03760, partial [Gammaproteobacteria bacterium]|nr:hypothetical protein [Gammaproteobacteria bacterium]